MTGGEGPLPTAKRATCSHSAPGKGTGGGEEPCPGKVHSPVAALPVASLVDRRAEGTLSKFRVNPRHLSQVLEIQVNCQSASSRSRERAPGVRVGVEEIQARLALRPRQTSPWGAPVIRLSQPGYVI